MTELTSHFKEKSTKAYTLSVSLLMFSFVIMFCYQYIDIPLAETLHRFSTPLWVQTAKAISQFGYAVYALVLFAIVYIVGKFTLKNDYLTQASGYVWLSIAVSGIICDILKIGFGRARPLMWFNQHDSGFHSLQFHANYWSFPSGHSTSIAACMVALWLVTGRFRIISWLVIATVCLSRLVANAHYLSDILAGCLLGSLVSFALYDFLEIER